MPEVAQSDFPDAGFPGPGTREFHVHRGKKLFLAVLAALAAGVLIAARFGPDAQASGSAALSLAVIAGLIAAAFVQWGQARDPRPILRVGPEGIEDRLLGPIPWSDVAGWRHSRWVLAPGFGYDLKPGAQPPRNASVYRLLTLTNIASRLPARSFKPKLTAGGVQPMADAFRSFRPDLERP